VRLMCGGSPALLWQLQDPPGTPSLEPMEGVRPPRGVAAVELAEVLGKCERDRPAAADGRLLLPGLRHMSAGGAGGGCCREIALVSS